MAALKVSNDNHAPYWSQPVLDRARELTARREARKRRAAGSSKTSPCADALEAQDLEFRRQARGVPRRWYLWDALGMPAQYGLTVVGALVLVLAAMELLSYRTAGL
ncbi:MAG: hypothetical protein AAF495_23335 [Pseudomonadota bacterium]